MGDECKVAYMGDECKVAFIEYEYMGDEYSLNMNTWAMNAK